MAYAAEESDSMKSEESLKSGKATKSTRPGISMSISRSSWASRARVTRWPSSLRLSNEWGSTTYSFWSLCTVSSN